MAKSSINFQAATGHTNDHMNRESKVNYLIDHTPGVNQYRNYANEKKDLERAEKLTKEKTKRSMQKSAKDNFVQEAIINLDSHHNIDDVERVFTKLNEKYGGFNLFNIAVHKDEGVFIKSEHNISTLTYDSITQKWTNDSGEDLTNDIISVAPNRDIFHNKADDKWYSEKSFKNEIDTNDLQMHMNFHAHATFTKYDFNNGKNVRLQKKDMQDIQTLVAKELEMERGEKGSNRNRLNHWQLKKQNDTLNAQKIVQKASNTKLLATQKNLKEAIKRQRDKLKKAKATREQYKALEELNRDLKNQIISKDLTIEELEKRLAKIEEEKKLTDERESEKAINEDNLMQNEQKEAYEQTIEELDKKDLVFKNFMEKNLEFNTEEEKSKDEKLTFGQIIKNKIKGFKDKIKDLLFKNEALEAENKELKEHIKKDNEIFERYEKGFSKIEEIVTGENKTLPLEQLIEKVEEKVNSKEIKAPTSDSKDKITPIPDNKDIDINSKLGTILSYTENAVSYVKGITSMNDAAELKKASLLASSSLAGIKEIIEIVNTKVENTMNKESSNKTDESSQNVDKITPIPDISDLKADEGTVNPPEIDNINRQLLQRKQRND